jgi:hypothetical protein
MRRPRTLSHARARTALRTPLTTVPLVALGLLLAACGGGVEADAGGAAPAPDTTSTETTAAPTTNDSKPADIHGDAAEARAVYDRYWSAWRIANNPPEPMNEQLRETAADPLLTETTSAITTRANAGVSMVPSPDDQYSHEVRSVTVEGDEASIVDCSIDDAVLVSESGQVLNDAVETRLIEARLIRIEGQWRVSDLKTLWRSDGVKPC